MIRVRFIAPAKREVLDAIDYYNEQRPGLGIELAREIRLTTRRIKEHPFAWIKIDENIRCCPANRFPYSLLYQIINKVIVIIALMHHKRNPDYWLDRL